MYRRSGYRTLSATSNVTVSTCEATNHQIMHTSMHRYISYSCLMTPKRSCGLFCKALTDRTRGIQRTRFPCNIQSETQSCSFVREQQKIISVIKHGHTHETLSIVLYEFNRHLMGHEEAKNSTSGLQLPQDNARECLSPEKNDGRCHVKTAPTTRKNTFKCNQHGDATYYKSKAEVWRREQARIALERLKCPRVRSTTLFHGFVYDVPVSTYRVVPPVDVITHEQIIGVWSLAAYPKQLHQVVKLPVHISAHRHGAAHWLHVRLFQQHIAGLRQKG